MVFSNCVCTNNAKSSFTKIATYQDDIVFKSYDGLIIGKCKRCGLHKTINNTLHIKQREPISTSDHYEENSKKVTHSFKPLVNKVKQFVKPHSSILDVGCSTGILLSLLKQENFSVQGIEPNKQAFTVAQRKLKTNVFHGTLSSFRNNKTHEFDCIIYNHTLEHIEDIDREFKLINMSLKKGAILVIGVPNIANIIFYMRNKYWESLLPDQHIWHFNTTYLKQLLINYGYDILDVSFSNHTRSDYPFFKKLYFNLLLLGNKLIHSGEAVLIIARKKSI